MPPLGMARIQSDSMQPARIMTYVSDGSGCAFGPSGEHHVRMAYCVPEDAINTAFDWIEAYYG